MKVLTISDKTLRSRSVAGLLLLCLLISSAVLYTEASSPDIEDINDSNTVYSSGRPGKNRIALTFDDGPHSLYTQQILDILSEENVRATFFIVGQNAAMCPELIDKIIDGGNELGNHTFAHTFLTGIDSKQIIDGIDKYEDEILRHSECTSRLLRPPGGIYDANVGDICNKLGYRIVLWSVDTKDWTGATAGDIEHEILDRVSDGAIILMHDYICGVSHTPEALKKVIPELKALGYEFVTVSELIRDG